LPYGLLEYRAEQWASFLSSQGTKADDLILGYMNKTPELVAMILGSILSGAVPCSVNPRTKLAQLLKIASEAGPKFIVIDPGNLLSLTEIKGRFVHDLRFVLMAKKEELKAIEGMIKRLEPNLKIQKFVVSEEAERRLTVRGKFQGERAGLCLFTSGSTGIPKGVLLSRDDLYERAKAEMEDYELHPGDRLLSLLPFSFDVGMNQLFASLLAGCHLVILNSYFPKDIAHAVKTAGITGISAVPSIWANMLAQSEELRCRLDLGSLQYVTISGGDLGRGQLIRLKSLLDGVKIFKTYGQTETFRSTMLKPWEFEMKMTSVGKHLKGTRVLILDSEGNIAKPNQEGEIIHFGVGTMLGYLNDPSGTAKKLKSAPELLSPQLKEKAIYTGDRGKMDEEGYLYVLGREDGMIKTWGFRVYGKEIENQILEFKGVRTAAVVGIHHPIKGQSILAEIVADPKLERKELERYLQNKLPHYMVPERIHLVDSLPMTDNGKINYPAIKGKYE
jgi:acyl-coenzyme A synthetase/AMP-(fatty) acid ligase